MALVDAGLVRLEYFDVGSGDPTVVLVHGASSSARIWHTVQVLLAQAGMRSLAIGMRGAGGSDRTTRLEDYTPSTYASDLSTALDALQVRRFVLVGHSLGVAVALEYMKEHAHESEVQALVLVAGGAGSARAAADANQGKQLEEALAATASEDEATRRALWEPNHLGLPEEVRDELWKDIQNNPRERLLGQRMFARPDMTQTLATMSVPTLVTAGDADGTVPIEATVQGYLKLPEEHRNLHIFYGISHFPNAQVPADLMAVMGNFIRNSVPSSTLAT